MTGAAFFSFFLVVSSRVTHMALFKQNRFPKTTTDSTATCSLTDEFLAYVQAASSVTEGVNVAVDDAPDGLRAQPNWVQDVWEKWVETLGGTVD